MAQAAGYRYEYPISDRVSVLVVDDLEVVEVEQAERDRVSGPLRVVERLLQALVESARVTESRQRIGRGQLHRRASLVALPLVEIDRKQRSRERENEERGALPEHNEYQRRRDPESKRKRSPAQRIHQCRRVRLSVRKRDHRRDQE